jgi:hypothetical protein
VNDQFEAPHPNGAVVVNDTDDGHRADPRRRRRRRGIFVVVALLICAAWAYAIWFSVTRGSPEDLDDAATAEVSAACTSAHDQLAALPDFTPETTATENVQLVRQENAIFDTMIATVDEVQPTATDAGAALDKWLDDWRSLVRARAAFADDLAGDGTARLRTPAVKSGGLQPITERMNGFAQQRGLDECQPDALQAEVVDGPRDYTTVED